MKFIDHPMKLEDVEQFIDLARKHDVSPVARSTGQFIDQLKEAGDVSKLSDAWKKKRDLFLRRSVPAYEQNPTHRRWISLIMWAYYTKPKHNIPEPDVEFMEKMTSKL